MATKAGRKKGTPSQEWTVGELNQLLAFAKDPKNLYVKNSKLAADVQSAGIPNRTSVQVKGKIAHLGGLKIVLGLTEYKKICLDIGLNLPECSDDPTPLDGLTVQAIVESTGKRNMWTAADSNRLTQFISQPENLHILRGELAVTWANLRPTHISGRSSLLCSKRLGNSGGLRVVLGEQRYESLKAEVQAAERNRQTTFEFTIRHSHPNLQPYTVENFGPQACAQYEMYTYLEGKQLVQLTDKFEQLNQTDYFNLMEFRGEEGIRTTTRHVRFGKSRKCNRCFYSPLCSFVFTSKEDYENHLNSKHRDLNFTNDHLWMFYRDVTREDADRAIKKIIGDFNLTRASKRDYLKFDNGTQKSVIYTIVRIPYNLLGDAPDRFEQPIPTDIGPDQTIRLQPNSTANAIDAQLHLNLNQLQNLRAYEGQGYHDSRYVHSALELAARIVCNFKKLPKKYSVFADSLNHGVLVCCQTLTDLSADASSVCEFTNFCSGSPNLANTHSDFKFLRYFNNADSVQTIASAAQRQLVTNVNSNQFIIITTKTIYDLMDKFSSEFESLKVEMQKDSSLDFRLQFQQFLSKPFMDKAWAIIRRESDRHRLTIRIDDAIEVPQQPAPTELSYCECHLCGRLFSSSIQLIRHLMNKHHRTVCQFCGSEFQLAHSLFTHYQKNHAQNKDDKFIDWTPSAIEFQNEPQNDLSSENRLKQEEIISKEVDNAIDYMLKQKKAPSTVTRAGQVDDAQAQDLPRTENRLKKEENIPKKVDNAIDYMLEQKKAPSTVTRAGQVDDAQPKDPPRTENGLKRKLSEQPSKIAKFLRSSAPPTNQPTIKTMFAKLTNSKQFTGSLSSASTITISGRKSAQADKENDNFH